MNVHPTKAEVRFRREGDVFAALQKAVRETVIAVAPVPEIAASAVAPTSTAATPWTTSGGFEPLTTSPREPEPPQTQFGPRDASS